MENLDKLDAVTKFELGEIQVKNSVKINAGEKGKLAKILTACAHANIENQTVSNGEIKFDGVVVYDFLVVLEGGEIVPICEKGKFAQVYENEKITSESNIYINSNLLELSLQSNISNEFSYSSILSFSFDDVLTVNDISCAKGDESVFTKEKEFEYSSLVDIVKADASVEFEIAKDSKFNKILFVKNTASIKSVIPAVDYFSVAGEVCSFIVYETEEGQIRSTLKENSFTEEIEAKGTTKESVIQAKIKTKENILNCEDDKFLFEVPFTITACIYSKKVCKYVEDAYSLTHDVNLTTTSLIEHDFYSTHQTEENIVTTFSVSGAVSKIDKILAVTPINITLVNKVVREEEILLEGIANLNIIYYTEDEDDNDILNSIDVEVPYSISSKALEVQNGDNVDVSLCLGDVNIKNRHSSELEILMEVKINYGVVTEKVLPITTQISLGEEKPLKDYSLEIYLAKSNQTLWDVAKELNISVDDLISQNGELSFPLENGQKIIAYTQKETSIK